MCRLRHFESHASEESARAAPLILMTKFHTHVFLTRFAGKKCAVCVFENLKFPHVEFTRAANKPSDLFVDLHTFLLCPKTDTALGDTRMEV